MTTPLTIDALPDGSGLRVTGELDASNAKQVADRLERIDAVNGVTLDLTGLDFIDSAGMNVLIAVARDLSDGARMLLRVRPDGPVRRVIDLMGIAEALANVALEEPDAG